MVMNAETSTAIATTGLGSQGLAGQAVVMNPVDRPAVPDFLILLLQSQLKSQHS